MKSILNGDVVPSELIVVDQSVAPDSALAAFTTDRPCAIRYLWSQTVGLSRANNIGVAHARYAHLVFTHDDILVTHAWFGTIVRALVNAGQRSVVTGRVRAAEPERPDDFAPSTKDDAVSEDYVGRIAKDVLFPMNMAMYPSAIEEVGNFDERLGPGTSFPAAEDNDYCHRLLEAGYRIIYVPEAVLVHRAWRRKSEYLPLRWNYGLGQGAFYVKYLSLRDHYMLRRMCSDIAEHSHAVWHHLLRFQRRAVCDHAAYALGLLFGALRWSITQRRR